MNIIISARTSVLAAGVATALLAACSAAPTQPDGAASLRTRLTKLQADPEMASRAPLAIKEADTAVTAAERPHGDKAVAAHLVYMADRKISIAEAQAQSRLAIDERKTLGEEREAMRLEGRTEEADSANRRAAAAQAEAGEQRRELEEARDANAEARRNAQELQAQIDELQAEVTDRGLVLTLGDVLFATNTAELNMGGSDRLDKLVGFLNKYPQRNALIEGYTDSVGSDRHNQTLSESRADAVKAYLVRRGIASARLTASGNGESSPVGDNSSATGRQQNRRVEVIIEEAVIAST